jgi:putative inorganic carbon (hco3(-)) transporter
MSFALFIVYILFTYLRPFETIVPDLAPYRPMLILWALTFISAGARALTRNEVAARPIHFWLLGALIVTIALSQIANQWAGGALPAVAEFSTAAMLMVLCLLNLTSLRRLQITCVVIACSVVFLAGLSIYSFHTGFMATELVLRQVASDDEEVDTPAEVQDYAAPADDKTGTFLIRVRSVGFLNDPNDFAQTMVMVLPLLWWFYAPGRKLRNLVVVAVPVALLGYATYLTHSRGALLGIAALGLLAGQRMLGLVRTLLLATLVVAGMSVASFGGRELSTKEQSAAQRIEAWQEGLSMLRRQPLLGVGYGNFTDHHYLTAHNSFVLCFAELGLVGYFAWLGLIVLTFKGLEQAVRLAPADAPERRLAMMLRASLTAFLACAWFLSRTYSPGLFVLLALCVASWFTARQINGPPPQSETQELLRWRMSTLLAMIASIAAVYVFVLVQRIQG